MLFDGWAGIGRVLIVGSLAYGPLVFLLRVSGKRTLTKLNAFDLVITVALGSTLATVLLSRSVALAEGITAMALLIALQFAITWLSVRSPRFQALIKAEPTLLVHQGHWVPGAMKGQRITREEILAAVRAQGHSRIEHIDAVVLETDGSMSVLSKVRDPAPVLSNLSQDEIRHEPDPRHRTTPGRLETDRRHQRSMPGSLPNGPFLRT